MRRVRRIEEILARKWTNAYKRKEENIMEPGWVAHDGEIHVLDGEQM